MESQEIKAVRAILDGDVEEAERILKTMSKEDLHRFSRQLGWLRDVVEDAIDGVL